MGYTFVPLTAALSPGERENRPPFFGHTRDGVYHASERKTYALRSLFPLPKGRVRVRGNDSSTANAVAYPGTPQYEHLENLHIGLDVPCPPRSGGVFNRFRSHRLRSRSTEGGREVCPSKRRDYSRKPGFYGLNRKSRSQHSGL